MNSSRLLVFLFLLLLSITPVYSADYALLVGVGAYPNLSGKSLEGPPNDVKLLKKVLVKRGFIADRIRTLTDGNESDGLPDRNNILQALEWLTKKVSRDDFVYLHFSGHGARQPQDPRAIDLEADGLDEIFLPRDVKGWKSEIQSVENAINDNEFGRYISAMRKKGAFVWAVFDTCHAGTMVRGANIRDVAYRQLDANTLGIPSVAVDRARALAKKGKKGQSNANNRDQSSWGDFVAFYAAQPNEQAPEFRLPYRSKTGVWHGLLSYTLAEVLASERPMTYRQAAQQILQRYGSFNQSRPTPMFEGTGLNSALLGGQEGLQVAQQWSLSVGHRGIKIPIGILGRVDKGSIVAIMAQPSDPIDKSLGYLEVMEARQFDADLSPVSYQGAPLLNKKKIPKNAWGRLVARSYNFSLSVALPNQTDKTSVSESMLMDLLDKMEKLLGTSIHVDWVKAGEPADIRLSFTPKGILECKKGRLWVLPANAEIQCSGPSQSISIDMRLDAKKLQQEISSTLSRIAKAINLQKVAAQLSDAESVTGLSVRIEVESGFEGKKYTLNQHTVQQVAHGDKVTAYASNDGMKAVDLSVLFIDGHYGIQSVFPHMGKSARVDPGSKDFKLFSGKVDASSLGIERMMVIAVQAKPKTPETSFSYLQQPSHIRTIKRGSTESNWHQLFNAAGFGSGSHRGAVSRMGVAGISMYQWRVQKHSASQGSDR